jgi:hypothetical protein
MKTRLRIRRNTQPGDHTIGWKNGKPVVRITTSHVELCKRMGIPVETFVRELLREKNT